MSCCPDLISRRTLTSLLVAILPIALRENAPLLRRQKQTSSDESDNYNHISSNNHIKESPVVCDGSNDKSSPKVHLSVPAKTASISSLEDRTHSTSAGDHQTPSHDSHDHFDDGHHQHLGGRCNSGDTNKGWRSSRLTSETDDSDMEEDKHLPEPPIEGGIFGQMDSPIMLRPEARLMPKRPPVDPIPLDHLSPQDRDLYLRDFLPPCPQINAVQKKSIVLDPNPPLSHSHRHLHRPPYRHNNHDPTHHRPQQHQEQYRRHPQDRMDATQYQQQHPAHQTAAPPYAQGQQHQQRKQQLVSV